LALSIFASIIKKNSEYELKFGNIKTMSKNLF
jgi:hypothetical protein